MVQQQPQRRRPSPPLSIHEHSALSNADTFDFLNEDQIAQPSGSKTAPSSPSRSSARPRSFYPSLLQRQSISISSIQTPPSLDSSRSSISSSSSSKSPSSSTSPKYRYTYNDDLDTDTPNTMESPGLSSPSLLVTPPPPLPSRMERHSSIMHSRAVSATSLVGIVDMSATIEKSPSSPVTMKAVPNGSRPISSMALLESTMAGDVAPDLATLPPLEQPIVIPQIEAGAGKPFNKAYAPILEYYEISPDRIFGFTEVLNAVTGNSEKLGKFLAQQNEQLFRPRGLEVSVMNSHHLAERLKVYDWTQLCAPLTEQNAKLSIQQRKIAGFKDRIAAVQIYEARNLQNSEHDKQMMMRRRRTMLHQDWFNPLEAYKQQQTELADDKEMHKTMKKLSSLQIKADKRRDKGIAKLDKVKQREFKKMKEALDKRIEKSRKAHLKFTHSLSQEMDSELKDAKWAIEQHTQIVTNDGRFSNDVLDGDPSFQVLQKAREDIIQKYHKLMAREIYQFELEKSNRIREFEIEKQDYEKVYQQNVSHLQKLWDKEMGRTTSNKRDREAEELRHTLWIVIDNDTSLPQPPPHWSARRPDSPMSQHSRSKSMIFLDSARMSIRSQRSRQSLTHA